MSDSDFDSDFRELVERTPSDYPYKGYLVRQQSPDLFLVYGPLIYGSKSGPFRKLEERFETRRLALDYIDIFSGVEDEEVEG